MTQRFAIALAARNPSGDPVRSLWERAGRLEATPSMEAQGYPPHLTLVIADGAPPSGLADTLQERVAGQAMLTLNFTRVRRFETAPQVLWLQPGDDPRLADWHRTAYAMVPSETCDPLYAPEIWEPHCTLATQVMPEQESAVQRFLGTRFEPFEVTFDRIELVRLPSLEIVHSVALSAVGDTC